eukprot:342695-Amphidinium_carterae.1
MRGKQLVQLRCCPCDDVPDKATMLVGKFLRTSTYTPAEGEPLLPPAPERPPPPNASQELESDASRSAGVGHETQPARKR